VVIIDVNKLGVTEIPKSTLGKIIECLSKGYRYRTKRMFVLNTSFGFKLAWKVIENFISVNMRRKIIMSGSNTDQSLLDEFHPSQLEKKYGGTASNSDKFWPPIMPSKKFGVDKELLISEAKYKLIAKENKEIRVRPDLFMEKFQLRDKDSPTRNLTAREISQMEINSSKWVDQDMLTDYSECRYSQMRNKREASVCIEQSD
jgi:hypothetical protein